MMKSYQDYSLYACLPRIALAQVVHLGPVIFWPASKAHEFLQKKDLSSFHQYLQAMHQSKDSNLTCLSIRETVSKEFKEAAMIDSIYLFYFVCAFKNLFFGQKAIPFDPFCCMIPGPMRSIVTGTSVSLPELGGVQPVDVEICKGLSQALDSIYQNGQTPESKETIQAYKGLVRSIRYFVNHFSRPLINLFGKGMNLSNEQFQAEGMMFLASSFESLFHINEKHPAADLKHKLRPWLHLKHGSPVELFWKWADDFYEVKKKIVSGETILDPLFRANPNFDVSHIFLGIKIYIYSVYYSLFQMKLIDPTHEDPFTPPDFKWIHPEEILIFFWSETILLRKLKLFIKQAQNEPLKAELFADIHFMTHLFVLMYDKYYGEPHQKGLVYKPTPLSELAENGRGVLDLLKFEQTHGPHTSFARAVHPHFIQSLQGRLQELKRNAA